MSSYQIILNGVMLAMDQQEVLLAFSRLFKLTPDAAAAMLAKPKTVLRSHLDAATAEKYREQLLAIGVDVEVRDATPSKRLTGEMESEQVTARSPATLTLEPLSFAMEDDSGYQSRYQGNRVLAIDFSGSGFGYFPIWVVNVLFTWLTLGIYSAWASVRSRNYFYTHAALDGAAFQYSGRPAKLLLQRLLVVVWLVFCVWSYDQAPVLVLSAAGSLFLLPLFLAWRTIGRYEALVWRGAGLSQDVNSVGLYGQLLLPVALVAVVFGAGALPALGIISQSDSQLTRAVCLGVFFIGIPYWHAGLSRLFTGYTRCGDIYFSCAATAWDYYKLYFLKTPLLFLLFFAPLAVAAYLVAGSDPLLAITGMHSLWHGDLAAFSPAEVRDYCLANAIPLLLLLLAGLWLLAYIKAGVMNLRFNGLFLDKTVVVCESRASVLFWIYLSNMAGILLTAGLFIPFAVVRAMRYRLSCITVHASYDLDDIVSHARFGGRSSDL